MAYPHDVMMTKGQCEIYLDCHSCLQTQTLTVPAKSYLEWRRGEYIQNAMPMLNNDQREMLISGICPVCWKKMFGETDA